MSLSGMPQAAPSPSPKAGARRSVPLTPGAGLYSARVAWRHSLRFRLALVYTLAALALIAVIMLGLTSFLLKQMDSQFDRRLNDRAEALSELYTNVMGGLGKSLPPMSGVTAVVDQDGRLSFLSPALQNGALGPKFKRGDAFPYLKEKRFMVQQTPMRAVTRSAGDFGTVWVALPEDDLVAARNSAATGVGLALLLLPLLMLPLGFWVGKRALGDLGKAADLADRIDPSSSLATLPLPAREDEVHRLLAAINRLLVRIEAGQAREKQLLGQIVHELGAPLTVLKASLARAGERTGDHEVIRAALVADELTFTTQDLMQLARGQLEMKLVWHYISAATLQGRLDRLVPNVQFTGDWTGGILCDPDRLTQALRNLLANARRAAGPQGSVTLNLEETPETVKFTVRDSGAGLPPELGERIFEPFVSGAGSSGLGLSVSRQISVLHGGSLTGNNHPSGGAQFVLALPGAALGDDEAGDELGDGAADELPEETR